MDTKWNRAVLLAVTCAAFALVNVEAVISNIQFKDCGSSAIIHKLWVEPCTSFKHGCHLFKNTNVTFQLDFQTGSNWEDFQHQVTGIIFGARIPFPAVQGSACGKLFGQLGCPLMAGHVYSYVNTFPILGGYPRIPVTIEYRLRTVSGEDLVCFLMDSKISNKPQ